MRNLVYIVAIMIVGQCCLAQEIIPLRENGTELILPETKNDGEVLRVTKVTHPRIHIYEPSSEKSNGQSIIICPGGGYSILALDKEGTEIAEWISGLGYTAYVLEYSVPRQKERAFDDLRDAITLVKKRAGSGSKVGVLGFSAGGHLAAAVSTSDRLNAEEKVDFTVLIYPAYLDQGENGTLSEEIKLTPDTPPIFIYVTADDPYGRGSIVLSEALYKNKTSAEFHMLAEGGHGYGMRKGEAAETWPILLEKWLQKQF